MGNTVIITGRNLQKLIETKDELPNVHFLQSDVSKPEEIIALHDKMLPQFPDLNTIVNMPAKCGKSV